jgi:hypothetical protein
MCVTVRPKPIQGFRQARGAQFRGSTGGFYLLRQLDHEQSLLLNGEMFHHSPFTVFIPVYFR